MNITDEKLRELVHYVGFGHTGYSPNDWRSIGSALTELLARREADRWRDPRKETMPDSEYVDMWPGGEIVVTGQWSDSTETFYTDQAGTFTIWQIRGWRPRPKPPTEVKP